MLKTAAFGLGFQHLPRDLANVNAWKTMFDLYIEYYTCMYEWRAKAQMIHCACTERSESAHFAHAQRHIFIWRSPSGVKSTIIQWSAYISAISIITTVIIAIIISVSSSFLFLITRSLKQILLHRVHFKILYIYSACTEKKPVVNYWDIILLILQWMQWFMQCQMILKWCQNQPCLSLIWLSNDDIIMSTTLFHC